LSIHYSNIIVPVLGFSLLYGILHFYTDNSETLIYTIQRIDGRKYHKQSTLYKQKLDSDYVNLCAAELSTYFMHAHLIKTLQMKQTKWHSLEKVLKSSLKR
jgi:hypothetical protein